MSNSEQAPDIRRFLQTLTKKMAMSETAKNVLQAASNHPYQCRCTLCLDWWAMVGPEEAEDGGRRSWGPFTEQEIREYHQGE